ncbi:hypothetical protein EPI10_000868 [Gossypium australe]|uniref:RNase H type-1 domain-containing protein n=1 Tax=Gossypium australe TaxID=47621 RepID=A0A5B6V9D0_9ROSI|nr:hypothetical protein EPI10_000868 [Gossypium australe]
MGGPYYISRWLGMLYQIIGAGSWRIMVNNQSDLGSDHMCPRCGCGPKTILYVCRDCPRILHMWHNLGISWDLVPDNISCPLTSEALACVRAIHFAQDLGFKNVELEGDSEVLISKLNVADIDRSMISSIIWDVK